MPFRLKIGYLCNNRCTSCGLETPIKPRLVHLKFSEHCNLRCIHCDQWQYSAPDPDFEIVKQSIVRLREWLGPFLLRISGKEHFMNPMAPDLVEFCDKHDVRVRFLSNGTLFTRSLVERLAKHRNFIINISVDGIGQVHDRIRGVDGTFDKVMAGIELLKEHGIKPYFITTIMKENLDGVIPLIKMASGMGIHVVLNPFYQNIGQEPEERWFEASTSWPDAGNVSAVLDSLLEMKHKGYLIQNTDTFFGLMKRYYSQPLKKLLNACRVGDHFMVVRGDGSMALCLDGKAIGNILNDDPAQSWLSAEDERERMKGCGMFCELRHCYYTAYEEEFREAVREMDDASKINDEVVFHCNIDIRRDFLELLAHARKRFRKVTLLTNGRMLSDKPFCSKVVSLVDHFTVYLHGERNSHNLATGAESYEQTIRGISNLRKLNATVTVSSHAFQRRYLDQSSIAPS